MLLLEQAVLKLDTLHPDVDFESCLCRLQTSTQPPTLADETEATATKSGSPGNRQALVAAARAALQDSADETDIRSGSESESDDEPARQQDAVPSATGQAAG